MITSLTLTNFQSHQKSSLHFCDGVNCIVGTTDSGKSAILRGLFWLAYNRPSGTSVIRNGSKLATVDVELVEKGRTTKLSRVRSKSRNEYAMEVDGSSQEFAAVGRDVPTEISDALGLDDINVQRQFDLTFLLFDSPGKVASVFNQFTNLDRVDKAIQWLASEIRGTKTTVKLQQEAKEEAEASLESLQWVDDLRPMVEAYEAVAGDLKALDDEIDELTDLTESLSAVDIKALRIEVAEYDAALDDLREQLSEAEVIEKKIWECKSQADVLDDQIDEISEFVRAYQKADHIIFQNSERVKALEEDIDKLIDKMMTLDVCPVCGQSVKGDAKEKMIEHYV